MAANRNLPAPFAPPQLPADPFALAAQQVDPPGIPWSRLRAAFRRYRWLMLAIVLLGAGAGFGIARHMPPEYEVYSTIWIATESPSLRNTGPIRAAELLTVDSWEDLLRSFRILDKVAAEQHLYVKPRRAEHLPLFANFAVDGRLIHGRYELVPKGAGRYALLDSTGTVVETGATGDSIGRRVGFRWALPSDALERTGPIQFTVRQPREAAIKLRNQLVSLRPPGSSILRLQLTGDDPVRTANSMNSLTREFTALAAELKKRNLIDFANLLERQLAYAERELKEAEIDLERFRVGTITLPSEGTPVAAGLELTRDPVLQNFFSQKVALDEVRQDRAALERALASIANESLDVAALWGVIATMEGSEELRLALNEYSTKQAALRNSLQVYTPDHPAIRDANAALTQLRTRTIPHLGRALAMQLAQREQALASRIEDSSRELRQIPTRTIEELRRRRNVETRTNLYTVLKNRYEEARLAEASAMPDVSILDTATTPQSPVSNTLPRVMFMAIAASIAIAFGLAILLDRADRRFRYPEQVADDLGLEIIGAVPSLGKSWRRGGDPLVAAQMVEAFRTTRLNITHAFAPGEPMQLTVTSPGIGDGKSVVCANLALSFAEAGYRTLLIDGDVRRGTLHTVFGVQRTPGLTDVLEGEVELEAVQQTGFTENLVLITAGRTDGAAPERLTSRNLRRLFEDVREQFDIVIVDSAPMIAGVDAFAFGVVTRNMLLVLRAGRTDRRMAQARLGLLRHLPTRILGVVINDVVRDQTYEYYHYDREYASVDERQVTRTRPRVMAHSS